MLSTPFTPLAFHCHKNQIFLFPRNEILVSEPTITGNYVGFAECSRVEEFLMLVQLNDAND